MPFLNILENNVSNQDVHIEQRVDVDKLETLICLEALVITCYQTLEWLVHNKTIRKEYQQFEQHAQYHQEELKKAFPLSPKSEVAIENKVNKYLLQLKPSCLTLREVINLIINLTTFKIDIYKYLSCHVQEHHEFLNNLLQDNVESMYFLRQEKVFHQNRLDSYLKI